MSQVKSGFANPLRRSLQARISTAFFLIVAVLTAVAGFGLYQQEQLQVRATAMSVRDLEPLEDLRAVQSAQLLTVIFGAVLENVQAEEARTTLQKSLDAQVAATEDGLDRLRGSVPAEFVNAVDTLAADRTAFLDAHRNRMAATAVGDRTKEAMYDQQAQAGLATVLKDFEDLAAALLADAEAQREAIAAAKTTSRQLTITVLTGAVLLAAALGWLLGRSIRRPVRSLSQAIHRLAAGDLTVGDVSADQDEIGRLVAELDVAVGGIREIIAGVAESAAAVGNASQVLTSTSHSLSAAAESTSRRAGEVSATADTVSAGITTVAAGAEDVGVSIVEIAKNAADAAAVGAEATAQARATNDIVAKLGSSSAEIGNVLKVITSIAEQTNLLALNATIEAARAGQMGAGFGVVASEVKDLAQETTRATEDIGRRVEAIQSDTAAAVEAIGQIDQIITSVNEHQTQITTAVEKQLSTAREVSTGVSEVKTGSDAIAGAIADVAEAAGQTRDGVADTEQAAAELAELSTGLQTLIARFRY